MLRNSLQKESLEYLLRSILFHVGLFHAYYAGHLLSLYTITIFAVFMLVKNYVIKIVFC